MKKTFFKTVFMVFTTVFLTLGLFSSCSDTGNDSDGGSSLPVASETIPEGYLRINYKGNGTYYLWVWKDIDASELAKCTEWTNGGVLLDHSNGEFECVDIKLADPASIVGIIVKSKDGNTKYSGNNDVMFYFPKKYNQIYFNNNNNGTIYVDKELTKEPVGTSSASITSATEITLNCNGVVLSDETVSLKDKNGNDVAISSFSGKKIIVSSNLKDSYATSSPYTLSVTDTENNTDTLNVGISSSLVETWFGTSASTAIEASSVKMGLTLSGTNATFKTWSPVASSVSLLLFADSANLETPATDPIPMVIDANGFWTKEDVSVSGYKYYKYRIVNNNVEYDVADIWSNVASADSVASQIVSVDDSSAMPDSWEASYTNPWTGSTYSDAIIYEMHVRDWSKPEVSTSTGKFLDIANGTKVIAHLQDLGVTHVQLVPCFDYAEKNSNTEYNWGYNPYHYNVPEGRYVTEGYTDGTQAVKEFRTLIKKLHEAGIAVNMDVVYNHTSGTGTGSLYDMTVPEYFYRFSANGSYSNGSGCGNEIATNHAMVKKYVIDSLKHWMNDYHINGFRFDLMGCQEQSTMKEIYEALYKIDPKVMVYGEPWTGGTAAVSSGCNKAIISNPGLGVGAFDDDYRNAIKGAEFGGVKPGQVQGTFADNEIIIGLTGSSTTRNDTGRAGLSLHYVECHDNYTLFDKLAISYLGKTSYDGDLFKAIETAGLAEVKKQDTLSAAYIFLSQGTPFINGGQEFLRTKKGDENSYSSNDDINSIDLSFATTYSDVYNTYKGLIALRKANPTAFGSNSSSAAEKVITGITKYTTGDFLVYFNATSDESDITTTGYSKVVDVTFGTPTESTTLPKTVPAKSFVILKK